MKGWFIIQGGVCEGVVYHTGGVCEGVVYHTGWGV